MRRRLPLLVALLTVPLLTQPARAAGKTTLTVDLANDAATLDPQLQWDTDSYTVYRNIFDNLVTRDVTGKIVPQVAAAWHYVNPTTIVFTLRRDIRFQNGTSLTAADVVFSIRRITNPSFRSPQLSQFDTIRSVDITGPDQVTLHLKTPYAPLLAQLVKLSIVPKAYVEKVGNTQFNEHPIGSGPYRLERWKHGVEIVLAANGAYWGGKPPFPAVIFRDVPSDATRLADLRTGRADIDHQMTPDDAKAIARDPALKVLSTPTERVGYLFINAAYGPTKNVLVRRAIAMAIDRNAIIQALLQGYAKPVNILLTPASFGYVSDVPAWPFDPKAARALLEKAHAVGAHLTFLTSPSYNRQITEAIQQMLDNVGLKVAIDQVDQPTFLRRREGPAAHAGNLAQGLWSCACQDADGTIWPLFHSGSIWSKYSNPAFDKLVDAARTSLDPKQRLADYHAAFEILHRDVPGIGLYQAYAIYGARKQLQWMPTPNEAFFVMSMRWK